MELLEKPLIKTKYQKCKLRVKMWESDFMEKYGRRPNKNDIKQADAKIKESYKMYWKLKTQALEETLLDITFTDEIQGNVSANSSIVDSLNSSLVLDNSINTPLDTSDKSETAEVSKSDSSEVSLKNVENIDPEKSPTKAEPNLDTPAPEDPVNVKGAWGEHLNKEETQKKSTKLLVGRSSSFQLSQKKFTSGTFSKRNPRKSLSMTKIKSKGDLSKSESTVTASSESNDQTNDQEFNPVLDNVKITQLESKVSAQPVNPICKLMSGAPAVAERKLNTGWLDRCAKDSGLEPLPQHSQRLSGISDSGIESMDTSVFSPPATTPPVSAENSAQMSDDEFVCNSDSEEENSRKRIRNWRKTLSDGSLPQIKRPCLEGSPKALGADTKKPPLMPVNKEVPVIKPVLKENILNSDDDNSGNSNVNNEEILNESTSSQAKTVRKKGVSLKSLKSSALPRKRATRTTRKPKKLASDDEEEEGEQKPKTRKPRAVRKTTVAIKTTELPEKKPRRIAAKRATRATKVTLQSEDDADQTHVDVPESSSTPDIPIYGVEALEVVPRFAVPRDTSGDLISEFSKTVGESTASTAVSKKPKSQMTGKEKLEEKLASGKVNENFVRINLKKKIFARGKRSFNFSRYKKGQWKQRKKELSSSEAALDLADLAEKNTCFKCGESGHMARRCPAMKSDALLPLDGTGEEPSEFPTLEEVERMAGEKAIQAHANRIHLLPKCPSMANEEKFTAVPSVSSTTVEEDEYEINQEDFDDIDEEKELAMVGHKVPEELIAKLLPPVNGAIDPVYSRSSEDMAETPQEVFDTLRMFGHKQFRPGQEKAIMRILCGQSTLVTLSTGSGKSLCYQLPAYVYSKRSHCITLVVSPLVSLMDDQVTGVPNFLSAAALHTGQTEKVREKIMQMVKEGNIDILLVSPEAVVAGEKSTGFGSLLRQLPPIAFACIDEAHCISQWSHNFRPSYLMICRVLMEKLGVKTILGLTATATKQTAESIVEHLKIHDGLDGVISDVPMPSNLTLTVSKDEHRDQALISLLRSERFTGLNSIIVYCTRREECERIAGLLRVSLQDTVNPDKPKPKTKVSQIAEAYHAGFAAGRRKVIQKAFMKGDTRIVVATVAFGMGINKADIRSVIHYNMPRNFEGYVQEVGRAGRDNLPAHCHLFLSPGEDSDKWELRRHIYANGVDRHTIRKLLQKIFVPCSCAQSNSGKRCPGHEVAIPVDETVRALDITEETISTLLCYLELHPKKLITVLSSVYVTAKVSSYNGPKGLKAAAQSSPPLAMAIALDTKRGISHEDSNVIEFPVVDVAAAIGWDSGVVKSHLKNLEWTTVNGKSKRSAISVFYDTLGLRVRAPGDLSDAELDEALEVLYERTQSQQFSALHQLDAIHGALNKFSHSNIRDCKELNEETVQKSEGLKGIIREYFNSSSPFKFVETTKNNKIVANESQIISDIRSLIASYRDNNFTGRAVARIFHGIQSPNYAALHWSRCRFWRAHLQVDFDYIVRLATKEILSMR